jgi:hypothetical protein
MGFRASAAARYAGKWLRLDHTAPGFRTVAAAVRLDNSFIDDLDIAQTLHALGTTRVDGQRALGLTSRRVIEGHAVTETLYVRAAGLPLPVAERGHGNGATLDAHWGNWNERVQLTAPAHSIVPS